MSFEASRPFLSRLDAADGRVPYEVLARWCRNTNFEGAVTPANYDAILDAYQVAHRQLSFVEVVQESVLDNIVHILNSTHMPSNVLRDAGLEHNSLVQLSVLNYGIPPYVGGYDYQIQARDFSEGVRQALLNHEPRLEAGSLSVRVQSTDPQHPMVGEIRFTIQGNITDLETGKHMELDTVVKPFSAPEIDRSQGIFS